MKVKRISPLAISYLKEALCYIYWYKKDLKYFLEMCIDNKEIMYSLDWSVYKRDIVSELIDKMYNNQERYISDLLKMINEVSRMNNFYHLEMLEDGAKKVEKARQSIKALREVWESHYKIKKDDKCIKRRKKESVEKVNANRAVSDRVEEIKQKYIKLISSMKRQKRGYELEKIMYDIFYLFDLAPKAAFKNKG